MYVGDGPSSKVNDTCAPWPYGIETGWPANVPVQTFGGELRAGDAGDDGCGEGLGPAANLLGVGVDAGMAVVGLTARTFAGAAVDTGEVEGRGLTEPPVPQPARPSAKVTARTRARRRWVVPVRCCPVRFTPED